MYLRASYPWAGKKFDSNNPSWFQQTAEIFMVHGGLFASLTLAPTFQYLSGEILESLIRSNLEKR